MDTVNIDMSTLNLALETYARQRKFHHTALTPDEQLLLNSIVIRARFLLAINPTKYHFNPTGQSHINDNLTIAPVIEDVLLEYNDLLNLGYSQFQIILLFDACNKQKLV